MTGLPSAGKSTIAVALAAKLRAEGHKVEILDGDVVRTNLSKGLGFSREDRDTNILRIGFVADLLARNGVKVISAAIAPYADIRRQVRELHAQSGAGFVEVYVATPVEVCAERDVKGLYAKQRAGELTGLTGVDDPYDVPTHADVTLPTQAQTLDESVAILYDELVTRGLA
jgi:adenylylsulfate kinase